MINLPEPEFCTGCGACSFACHNHAISFITNNIGCTYPKIDTAKCVECHKCEKTCPVLNVPTRDKPMSAYASWSKCVDTRSKSASGGVAFELYKYALLHGYKAIGAVQDDDFSVRLKITESESDLKAFQNSKYVFCDMLSVYKDIAETLNNHKIIFIGLPCQVAAIKKTFNNNPNILLVEILCHGNTPLSYLKQHISKIETENGRKASYMFFRDPNYLTENFVFSLYTETDECFYARNVREFDTYQYGYHRGVSYRPNCYNCVFADVQRVGDIVLSDFWALGSIEPCSYNHNNVSCVLTITSKGNSFFNTDALSERVFIEKRPIEEAYNGNKRLLYPTPKTEDQKKFHSKIVANNGDFEKAIEDLALRQYRRENENYLIKLGRRIISKISRIYAS